MLISAEKTVGHYENFPVASILIPKIYRAPITALYNFARTADDIADEGEASNEIKIKQLEKYEQSFNNALENINALDGYSAVTAPMAKICNEGLPINYPRDLIKAFIQDLRINRYQNFTELLQYCQNSANPIGRSLLHFYGKAQVENNFASDSICSALQLINFWQDINVDWQKNRIYIPAEILEKYNFTPNGENSIKLFAEGEEININWQNLMLELCNHSRQLMLSGKELPDKIGGRCGFELRLVILGGLTILNKIIKVRGDVFRARPQLKLIDWGQIFYKAIFKIYK